MLMQEQQKIQRQRERDNSDGSMGSPNQHRALSNINWKTSMKALLYKSIKVQQRSICSNICQIITPLLCVAFTLVVQIISSQVVTSKVQMPSFPRPFSMPVLYELLPLNLSCNELYLYTFSTPNKKYQTLLSSNLKRYCDSTESLSPQFIEKNASEINTYMINLLKQAQKQPYNHGVDMKAPIPDGVFRFHQLGEKLLDVTVSVNDYRLSEYHRNNGVTKLSLSLGASVVSYVMTTEGLMSVIEKVTRPFLQISNPKQIIFGSYMYMPFDGEDTALIDKTVNIVGAGLYPLGLSLLLPLFLYSIVSQKQQKLVQIMRMNGLKLKYYWICTFIFNFSLSILTFFIFYVFGTFVLGLSFFTQTSAGLMWVMFVGWAVAQIGMTNFVQVWITNGKSATIVGYILSIFSTLLGETIAVAVYADPLKMPIWLLLYPPFSLCRIIYLMGIACSSTGCYSSISHINSQATTCLLILYSWFLIFLFSIWLNDQIQQDYGVAKKSKITEIGKRLCKFLGIGGAERLGIGDSEIEIQMREAIGGGQDGKIGVDVSVRNMKMAVMEASRYSHNLIIKELSKKYQTSNGREDYIALKPLTLAIQDKQIFGLLGPNGAGKTTLISVLTGMYPSTSGNAWINGIEVSEGEANEYIGVCPQFDLLWSSLTVYEHVKFYAILKGINQNMLEQKIQQSLDDVDLGDWRDTVSGELSGGMQRRLSIAIALVGSPSVVFLDEPSSGLDPSHRRRMWQMLKKCKSKTSIILTTHLMQQAEQLCNRLAIISKGELRCIGSPKHLKQHFGQGYRLHINFINMLDERNKQLIKQLQQKFNTKIINRLQSRIIVKVQKNKIFQCVKFIKDYRCLKVNWMVTQPSLYDVFMCFVQ